MRAEQLAWNLAKALRAITTPIGGEVLAPLPSELDAARRALAAFDAVVEEALAS